MKNLNVRLFVFLTLLASSSLGWAKAFQIPLNKVGLVSLLIADPGKKKESSRGHAALRISWGKTLSPRDLVINFGAKMPNGTTALGDFFRGTGFLAKKYPSSVTASNYGGFKAHYKKESRGLSSHVLALEPHELAKIIPFINAELATGKGHRDFQILSYNCAVMVVEALNAGLDERISAKGSNMPDTLGQIFKNAGLVTTTAYDPVD